MVELACAVYVSWYQTDRSVLSPPSGGSQPERNAVDAVTMETESVDTDYRGAAVDGEGWNGRGGWGGGGGLGGGGGCCGSHAVGRVGACVALVGGYVCWLDILISLC